MPSSNSHQDSQHPRAISVSDLSYLIKNCLEETFPEAWVVGEISNLTQPSSGHIYMTLKDDHAQLRSVVWRTTAQRMQFDLKNGMKVVCRGSIDLYPPRGAYQLVCNYLEPVGMGSLQLAFKKLHAKLQSEGLFEAHRKKSIPVIPKKIGLITSPTGAAIRDFLQVLKRRWNGVDILLFPSRVQGEGAERQLANAIRRANQIQDRPDVLVLTRGGGSLEDLWCFNEELLVREIASSEIPIISAVGHEIDVTLSDLAADVRALTPSEAAERIVPQKSAIVNLLNERGESLKNSLRNVAQIANYRLESIAKSHSFTRPMANIQNKFQTVDENSEKLSRAMERQLENRLNQLKRLAIQLESVSPLGVFQRGYSITTDSNNELLSSIHDTEKDALIKTRVTDGTIISVVQKVEESQM